MEFQSLRIDINNIHNFGIWAMLYVCSGIFESIIIKQDKAYQIDTKTYVAYAMNIIIIHDVRTHPERFFVSTVTYITEC